MNDFEGRGIARGYAAGRAHIRKLLADRRAADDGQCGTHHISPDKATTLHPKPAQAGDATVIRPGRSPEKLTPANSIGQCGPAPSLPGAVTFNKCQPGGSRC